MKNIFLYISVSHIFLLSCTSQIVSWFYLRSLLICVNVFIVLYIRSKLWQKFNEKKNHIEFSCSIFMSFSISDVNLVKHYFSLFGFVWYKSTFDVSGRRSVRPAVCPSVWLSMKILWWNFNVDKNILTKIVWKQKNLLDISCIIFFIPFSMICGFSFVYDIEGKNK